MPGCVASPNSLLPCPHTRQSSGVRVSEMSALVAVAVAAMAVCWLAAGASCEQAGGAGEVGDSPLAAGLRVAAAAYRQCRSGGHLLACLQLKALKAADRALAADRVPLLEGVELVRTGAGRGLQGEGATPLDEERLWGQPGPLGALLVDRAASLLDSHALRISPRKLFAEEDVTEEEGRKGSKKLKKYGGILLLAGIMKAGMLALATKAVAALAVAALVAGTIALVLAAIIGFGTLLSHQGGGSTTYEIVKHPHVKHVKTHSSSHEYVGGHEDHEEDWGGGDHYESRVGGSDGYPYYGGRAPNLRAHPLAYRWHAAALKAAAKS
ncbi:uncharacterized protein LOC134534582 [Bacillus rossius redtenbacheri]|uniref:uncharacterized protein LOC134534582 n=1 Tax=Bacillus rossius redtenbacheri TaxID=93214 RepID=UPI002FDEAA5A